VTLYVGEDINLLSDHWVCDPQSFSQVYCFVSALAVGMTLRFGPEPERSQNLISLFFKIIFSDKRWSITTLLARCCGQEIWFNFSYRLGLTTG
jgi:hypothetical protein